MTTQPPQSSGGMPKWLIILIVILLVIVLGCCGLFGACYFMARSTWKSANTSMEQFQKQATEHAKQAQAEFEKRQAEQEKQAQDHGEAGAVGDMGAVPTAAGHAQSPNVSTKIPANFPPDVPLYTGLTATFAISDKTADSGSVMFTGPRGSDTIAAFYEKEMSNKGWTADQNTAINETSVQQYSKGARKATITVAPDANQKTLVTVVYTNR